MPPFLLLVVFGLVVGSNVNQDKTSADHNNFMAKEDHLQVVQNPGTDTHHRTNTTDRGDNTGEECFPSVNEICPDGVACEDLSADCLTCNFNTHCQYGEEGLDVVCRPRPFVNCTGSHEVRRQYTCRYCYQLEPWQYTCNTTTACSLNKPRKYHPARPFYTAVCKPHDSHHCLGRRCFYKQQSCNWSHGYKWSTALILSITLGGFGVDRFYLGMWREGIGKLFSFGGLGVWTIVDVILIAVGYITPSDGSLYI